MREYRLKSNLAHYRSSIDYENDLNTEQLEVVFAKEGPFLVIAGAGSGKTRTVTYRVARLLEDGIEPSRVLLVTFTNKAAKEMLRRVGSLINMNINRLWGGTFHHIGNLVLRAHAKVIGYENNYTILDREDAKELLNTCIAEKGLNKKESRLPAGDLLMDIISLSVNANKTLEEIILNRYPHLKNYIFDLIMIAKQYSFHKKRLNLMDFDDLLFYWKYLLEQHPEIRKAYCKRFHYILVDEYQDTNKIQSDIIDILASLYRNVMVVGDDSQSIYSFRGANFENIIEFPKRYPDTKVFKLETNYRSTPEILYLANCSIDYNQKQFRKKLKAIRKSGTRPALVSLGDVIEQANFVAQRIIELKDEEDIFLNDISVLYRAHYHSMELQMELTRRGIPFEIRSGLRFFEQAHIKDIIGFLRIIVNPFDELSWKRLLKLFSGIGNVTAGKIWKFLSIRNEPLKAIDSKDLLHLISNRASSSLNKFREILSEIKDPPIKYHPDEMIRIIMEAVYIDYLQDNYPNFESRIEDITQLSHFSSRYNSTGAFLSEMALLTDLSTEQITINKDNRERIILSSIHQAKGLEWKVVFLIWCVDGRFPSSRSLEDHEGEEEERRLFYVATTRARDDLYICYPTLDYYSKQSRRLLRPSRFIKELKPSVYEKWLIKDDFSLFSYPKIDKNPMN
ncbi:MAG: ATP-dependent helicase [Thermodesulfobacteriota bacterium]|nr:ATP-dependent helicase [Thermodesulfobacteriota bacterium]